MALSPDHPTREHLAWAQWWVFPWKSAHADWKGAEYPAIEALFNRRRSAPDSLTGVTASLPAAPHPTVLRLALSSTEQLNLVLTLVHDTFNPAAVSPLNESHHLWCIRLSKALPPGMLPPHADPLRLLHSWVEPAIWQRLRLRFPRQRVRETERASAPLENANSRLNTLWQAVVWRVTTTASDSTPLLRVSEDSSDVMPTHH
ncbi:hypothetical protein M2392_001817 [Pseudomonas grimontii]|nr:hypothetical protein [Pseudomonas grimontii]